MLSSAEDRENETKAEGPSCLCASRVILDHEGKPMSYMPLELLVGSNADGYAYEPCPVTVVPHPGRMHPLDAPVTQDVSIFRWGSGSNELVASMKVGGSYRARSTALQKLKP
jgi:hypothetical protein